jgi:hypothetical protein
VGGVLEIGMNEKREKIKVEGRKGGGSGGYDKKGFGYNMFG